MTLFSGAAIGSFLAATALSCASADGVPVEDAHAAAHPSGEATRRAPGKAPAPRAELGSYLRYVVQLGDMRDGTHFRRDGLGRVLRDSARAHASALKDATVVEDVDASLVREAAERHLPVITLDGVVTQLIESSVSDGLSVRADVEFTLRREQVLKATLSGAATTLGSSPTISDRGRRRLEDDAIDGAVQSALRGADQGLLLAAR